VKNTHTWTRFTRSGLDGPRTDVAQLELSDTDAEIAAASSHAATAYSGGQLVWFVLHLDDADVVHVRNRPATTFGRGERDLLLGPELARKVTSNPLVERLRQLAEALAEMELPEGAGAAVTVVFEDVPSTEVAPFARALAQAEGTLDQWVEPGSEGWTVHWAGRRGQLAPARLDVLYPDAPDSASCESCGHAQVRATPSALAAARATPSPWQTEDCEVVRRGWPHAGGIAA
jgi:hypothetical protein